MRVSKPAESTALICSPKPSSPDRLICSPNADGRTRARMSVSCAPLARAGSMGAGRDDAPEEESPVISDRASSASISVHP